MGEIDFSKLFSKFRFQPMTKLNIFTMKILHYESMIVAMKFEDVS